ncbi:winged helix-turn-helix domain-containing protein [Candidatus Woesearchaeota archaeon]|nr:winged helix-turn-helix domain-containing protein [Candidatus Woesearchaeota archaeon]
MDICVYYDEKKGLILDISPRELPPEVKNNVEEAWTQPILKNILILLSEGVQRLPDIQTRIGHSPSTLHAAVERLEQAGLITTKMIYKGNKQKVLTPNVLCVTKNPKSKIGIQKFFQGLWINSHKTNTIIKTMQDNKKKWWSAEELSLKLKMPVDEISLLLSNFDSPMTKALSHVLKEPPFEKKTLFRAK